MKHITIITFFLATNIKEILMKKVIIIFIILNGVLAFATTSLPNDARTKASQWGGSSTADDRYPIYVGGSGKSEGTNSCVYSPNGGCI